MKKYGSILVLVCYTFFNSSAQLYDAQWMLGPRTSTVDFRTDPPSLDTIHKSIVGYESNAAISNYAGELLYYTNGIYIAGKQSSGDSILNGNGLNPCPFTTQYSSQGIPYPQSSIFLNKPGDAHDRYYYLIHFSGDNNGVAYTLYYSLIDAQGNFGLGEVISKNDTFYQGITRTGGMAACKHANGRDWWIVTAGRNNNLYRKFLLTPSGITDTLLQNIGPVYQGGLDQCYSRFSLDGTKYVTSTWAGLTTVMDFNRCTGEFSNPVVINNAEGNVGKGGLAEFSPNGRFVYLTNTAKLEQYDLNNPNVQDSVVLYRQSAGQYASTKYLSLALDGRLYCSTWAGGYYFMSVINNPDELGLNCNFVYGGQPTLSGNSINVSNTANPRLGALIGSGCDTITAVSCLSPREKGVKCFPNPADKAIYIEMPNQGNYVFELLNPLGQLEERRETKQVDIINLQSLDNGTYLLRVLQNDKEVSITKVVVQHPH